MDTFVLIAKESCAGPGADLRSAIAPSCVKLFVGDGPAQYVRISIRGAVTLIWKTQKVRVEGTQKISEPPVPAGSNTNDVPVNTRFVSSYLPTKTGGVGFLSYSPLYPPEYRRRDRR